MQIKFKIFKNENQNKKTGKIFTSYTTIMLLDGVNQYVSIGFKYDTTKSQITSSGLVTCDDKDVNLSFKNDKYKLYVNSEKIEFKPFNKANVTANMFVLTNEKDTDETSID